MINKCIVWFGSKSLGAGVHVAFFWSSAPWLHVHARGKCYMDKHPYNDKNNDNNHDKTINNKLIITQTEYKE